MNNNELQELAKLVKEKGFKTQSITTGYTFTYLLGGKNIMINETCIYLFLCEIQKWLREVHNIYVYIIPDRCWSYGLVYDVTVNEHKDKKCEMSSFESYEKALQEGLQEALKLINN